LDSKNEFGRLVQQAADLRARLELARTEAAAARYSKERRESEKWLTEGLPYAKKIFEWARAFKASDLGRSAFAATEGVGKNGKSLVFYAVEGRRHNIPIIFVAESGVIEYYGHRYDGELVDCRIADSPETLSLWANPEFLKKALDEIESGEVYNHMAKHFNWQIGIWNSELNSLKK